MSILIDSAVGIDPGYDNGVCFLDFRGGVLIGKTLVSVNHESARGVLGAILHARYRSNGIRRRIGSVEAWVDGKPGTSAGDKAKVTRQLVMEFAEELEEFGYAVQVRKAADVKPWATDKRLEAAGIYGKDSALHGAGRHAADGARHALFGAWESGICPNPLLSATAKAAWELR